MKKFFQTIRDIFSIEDLRIRILNTIGFLIIFRLGSFVVLPGVDPDKLTTPGGFYFCFRDHALHICIHCDSVDDGGSALLPKTAKRGRLWS